LKGIGLGFVVAPIFLQNNRALCLILKQLRQSDGKSPPSMRNRYRSDKRVATCALTQTVHAF
jgi:hypothetical protein